MLVQTKFDYFSMKSKQCWEAASPNEFVSLYRLGPLHSSRCLAHAKVEPGHPDSWKTKVSGNMQHNFTTASLQTVAQPLLPLMSHCLLLCFPISNSQDLNQSTEGRLQKRLYHLKLPKRLLCFMHRRQNHHTPHMLWKRFHTRERSPSTRAHCHRSTSGTPNML